MSCAGSEQRQTADAWRRLQSPEVTPAMDSIRRMLAEVPPANWAGRSPRTPTHPLSQTIRDSGIFAQQQAMIANILGSPGMTSYL